MPFLAAIALAAALPAAAAAPAPQEGLPPTHPPSFGASVAALQRLADPVAALDGEARAERMLFFWDKTALLRIGDGLRQGPAGICELRFDEDGTELRCFGETWATIEAAGPKGHAVRFHRLRRVVAELRGVTTRLLFPGGTEIHGHDTWIRITLDEFGRAYRLRNAGPGDVAVLGPVVPHDQAALAAGHEVVIQIVDTGTAAAATTATEDGAAPGAVPVAEAQDSWAGLPIRLGPNVTATKKEDELLLEGEGVARLGGARIVLRPGGQATVWKPSR